jgi:large subunit ribosomal protein L13
MNARVKYFSQMLVISRKEIYICSPFQNKGNFKQKIKFKYVDTLSYKTKSTKNTEVVRQWFIVDVEGEVLGRIGSKVASVLRGKHKPSYTANTDTGDYVIVINADKIRLSGAKLDDKVYLSHSGYPGGQKSINAKSLMEKHPTRVFEKAIRGMLPKTKLGRAMIKKLFVYAGAEHPHAAQKPEELK